MNKEHKRINGKNFPVFQKLIEEVFLKATGKSIEKVSEKICDHIADIIKENIGITSLGGKSLENYINAVLSNDYNKHKINPEYPTLNNLAKYASNNFDRSLLTDEQNIKNNKTKDKNAYWINFEKKYAHLLLQEKPGIISDQESNSTEQEIQKMPEAKATGTAFFSIGEIPKNNPLKITQTETNSESFLSNETSILHRNKIDTKKFIRAGVRGGIFSGIVASIIIVLVRYMNGRNITPFSTGYENVSFDKFMQYIFAPLLLFQMAAGALLGWLCCYTAATKIKFFNNFLLFIIFFIVIIVLRQSMARDAWYIPGTYPNHDEQGNIKMGGGLLGEPDFETLATGLMGAFVILILVQAFRKNRLKASSAIATFGLIIKATIYGILAWCIIYGIYILLTVRLQIMHKYDYLIAPSFFTVDFPHPERPIFSITLYMVYVLCLIISIQYQFHNKKERLH